MKIQVRQSKRKRGLVVLDPNGDMHVCCDPKELWETMADLNPSDRPEQHVAGTTVLEILFKGENVVIIESSGEAEICENAKDLWECIDEILTDTVQLVPHRPAGPHPMVTVTPDYEIVIDELEEEPESKEPEQKRPKNYREGDDFAEGLIEGLTDNQLISKGVMGVHRWLRGVSYRHKRKV